MLVYWSVVRYDHDWKKVGGSGSLATQWAWACHGSLPSVRWVEHQFSAPKRNKMHLFLVLKCSDTSCLPCLWCYKMIWFHKLYSTDYDIDIYIYMIIQSDKACWFVYKLLVACPVPSLHARWEAWKHRLKWLQMWPTLFHRDPYN